MTVQEMHYDFKFKYNKVDSQKNRNFQIPEIDWFLNEAEEIFIKTVAFPRFVTKLGFETSTRNLESIQSIVKTEELNISSNFIDLPEDYKFFVKAFAEIKKDTCTKKAKFFVAKHNNLNEFSLYENTSFFWQEVYGRFEDNKIKFLEELETEIKKLFLTYIRKTAYIHNAQAFNVLGYELPGGQALTGTQNCELPENTHREIVDIAVMLASGNLQTSDFNIRMNKLSVNQIL